MWRTVVLLGLVLTACWGRDAAGTYPEGLGWAYSTGELHPVRLNATGSDWAWSLCLRSCGYIGQHWRSIKKANVTCDGCSVSHVVNDQWDLRFEVSSDLPSHATLVADLTFDDGEETRVATPLDFVAVEGLELRCNSGACGGPLSMLPGSDAWWSVAGLGTFADGGTAEILVNEVSAASSSGALTVEVLDAGRSGWAELHLVAADAGTATITTSALGVTREVTRTVVDPGEVVAAHFEHARVRTEVATTAFTDAFLEVSESPLKGDPLPPFVVERTPVDVVLVGELADGGLVLGDASGLSVTPQDGLLAVPDSFYDFATWSNLDPYATGAYVVRGKVGAAEAKWVLQDLPARADAGLWPVDAGP